MNTRSTNSISRRVLALAITITSLCAPVFAQKGNAPIKTDTKIAYHNGPVMQGHSNVYVIWYGSWNGSPGHDTTTQNLVFDFVIGLGTSSYLQINVPYVDAVGNGPGGGARYSGTAFDNYSRGVELDAPKIQGIINDQIASGVLPLDGAGIYLVLGSADVSANSVGYCQPGAPPHHSFFLFNGAYVKYAFIGHPLRCPSIAAPHLSTAGPTPNDNYSADAIANIVAAAIPATITNPVGHGWFDRYGLENTTKCAGTFGETYTTANGARANVQLGFRHWLIQQNWVNSTRKGYCALAPPAQP
jgi:Phosphate-induced protein 1 conserved region